MSELPAAELDYAFPAHWARVNSDGTLTAIDASFLQVAAATGTHMGFAVAARVRFKGSLTHCDIKIDLKTPSGATLSYVAMLDASTAPVYGKNRRHLLLALNSSLLVEEYGDVQIDIYLDDLHARSLQFAIVQPAELQSH